MVGWSEPACAAVLLASIAVHIHRAAHAAAIILVPNQLVAAVHILHAEAGALPRNALLSALLLVILADRRPSSFKKERENAIG